MPDLRTTVTGDAIHADLPEWAWDAVERALYRARITLDESGPIFRRSNPLGMVTSIERLSDVDLRPGRRVRSWRVSGRWGLLPADPIVGMVESGQAVLKLAVDVMRDPLAQSVVTKVTGVHLVVVRELSPRVGFRHLDQGSITA